MKNLSQYLAVIAGLGAWGNPEHVSPSVIEAAKNSGMLIVPRADPQIPGLAENLTASLIPGKILTPLHFPMTRNTSLRDSIILSQLRALKPKLEQAGKIFFPVIGDATLYSTGQYFLEALRKVISPVEARFIPGISAHSLAASVARQFLASDDEIMTIIPGTSSPDKIRNALNSCDCAAIYKPSALKELPPELSQFSRIIRVDFAGDPQRQRIYEGLDAVMSSEMPYMSVLLLWR
ncbi:MAG: precorrin-2 C(20)-methyltransferase [Synergistaceae bacterium]|nr:precorrin-2 C(20)-methyltransferase [Synergistaceae bacterium]